MNLRAKRKALLTEAASLLAKAETSEGLTDEETARSVALKAELDDVEARIKADDEARAALKAITGDVNDEEQDGGEAPAAPAAKGRVEVRERETIGDRFVKSDVYRGFQKAHPSGLGRGSRVALERTHVGTAEDVVGRKADLLTSDVAHLAPARYPTLDMIDRPRLSLLDVISRGTMSTNSFEYVQITGVTRRAGLVPEATGEVDEDTGEDLDPLKPISTYKTALADAKAYTYADGYEVTTQLLSDANGFATFLNAEIPYSLDTVLQDTLLNGDGTDGTPKGIRHTTGVQSQAFDTDLLTTIRKAITKVTRIGGAVTAVLVSPEVDEQFDLLQDSTGRYLGQGPWASGPGTAWGRPRVVSELLSGTTDFILGDFSTVALLDREGLSIEAFTQHKDFAQRNKVYVRAELRAAQVIWRPNRLVIGKTAA